MMSDAFWSGVGGPPAVDTTKVTATVEDVALLERTRTLSLTTDEETGTFSSDTRPTDSDVSQIIQAALDEVLAALPPNVDPIWYPAIKRAVALRAAVAIEVSFYREQADASASSWISRYTAELSTLQGLIPKAHYVA